MRSIRKPVANEFPGYATIYIALYPDDGQIMHYLGEQSKQLTALVHRFDPKALTTPCSPGEWTIQEILMHIIDIERVLAYRALRFARNDATPIPGVEEGDYVLFSGANERALDNILEEYLAVRTATLSLFENLDSNAFSRHGTADGNAFTVRGLLWMIAGHELHHIHSIEANYLPMISD